MLGDLPRMGDAGGVRVGAPQPCTLSSALLAQALCRAPWLLASPWPDA